MKLFFSRGKAVTDRESTLPLYINNCGYYKEIESPMPIVRNVGREDFHIIFVARGEVKSSFGVARDGECIFYPPKEQQRYSYEVREKSLYFWIHYSGTESESIIEGTKGGIIKSNAHTQRIHELFSYIVHAVTEDSEHEQKYALGLLRAMGALICAKKESTAPFRRAIELMRDFSKSYCVGDYAAAEGLSEGHFIREFKKATGRTPTDYRTNLQIEQAKALLFGTPLKIKAIAAQLGFSDALYFCRIFKTRVGVCPSEFRKMG